MKSIILLADKMSHEKQDELEAYVKEISKYFKLVKPSQMIENLHRGKRQGFASIIFQHPRQSLFNYSMHYLLKQELPFGIALRSDCVGFNKLPEGEESHPEKANPTDFFVTWGKLNGVNPNLVEYGLNLVENSEKNIKEEIKFVSLILKRPIYFALSKENLGELPFLKDSTIQGVIYEEKEGDIEKKTDPYKIPVFTKI